MMPQARTRLAVVGKPDMGKSSHVKRLVKGWLTKGLRVVAFDPHDEYSSKGNPQRLVDLGPLRQRLTARELAMKPQALLEPRLSLAVVASEHPRDAARGFLLLSRLVKAAGKPCVVVVDEVGLWTNAARHPACHAAAAELCAVAIGDRKKGVSLVVVGQRMSQVPSEVRSTLTDVHAFLQDQAADLEAIEDRCGPQFAGEVSQLRQFHHAAWSDVATTPQKSPTLRRVV